MSYAYVGCRTTKERNARGEGLKTYHIDDVTGEWKEIQCLKTEENPSYQCFDNDNRYLYSVHGDITKVSSYKIMEDGTLKHLNTVDIGGKNPVFITVDKTNRFIIVATLQGGALYSLQRNEDGTIGEIVDKQCFEGKKEGSVSFPHQCYWDQDKNYIFAPAQGRVQGYAQVRVYRFDSETGMLHMTCQRMAREDAEPRHLSVHPNNRYVYMVNEKDNTMTFLEFDKKTGELEPRQITPMLPDTYVGNAEAGASVILSNGKIVIGSSRTFNKLVLFRVDQNTGYLTRIGYYDTLGKIPRFMGFNQDESKFYVANEESDTIVEMALDKERGTMEYTGRIIETGSPVCITFRN